MTRSEPVAQRRRRKATRAQGPAEVEPGTEAVAEPAVPAPVAAAADVAAPPRPSPSPTPSPSPNPPEAWDPAGSWDPTGAAPAPVAVEQEADAPSPRKGRRLLRWVGAGAAVLLVAALVAAVVLLALAPRADDANARREAFVQTARQGVLNLTTIHYATAPEDVQHLLDGASGPFAQDFGGRKDSYIQVVQKAQVNSDGKIIAAGLEKLDANTGVVLVASTAKVSNSSAPQGEDRSYRLRVTVTDDAGRMTVSNVEFVP